MLERNITDGKPVGVDDGALLPRLATRYEVYKRVLGITDSLSPRERRAKLSEMFLRLADSAARLLDNCQDAAERDKRIEESDIGSGVEQTARAFALCAMKVRSSVDMVEECLRDIDRNPRVHRDGMSLSFEACAEISNSLKRRLDAGYQTIQETSRLSGPNRPSGLAELSKRLGVAAMSFFLVFEDILAS